MRGSRVGPFLVKEKLGAQKRNQVYRATQVEQQRDVALKFINLPPEVEPAKAIGRIQQETKILKQLNHPNLVKVHGAGIENGQIFFALDLIEGEPLSAILSRRSKLTWEQASDYARQIACCLEYLHSQELLHLKLTPDKILITPDNQVKITDLRLNRKKKKRWDSVRKKSMDLAAYLPPEQFSGERGTIKSDFYAMGVILFEMLTGKLPYTGQSFAALGKQKEIKKAPLVSEFTLECPMWMEKVVETLLQNDPNKRPFSARAIIVALDDVRQADISGESVAEKLVSGFSPLTAGQDKSEARKALGIKPRKKKTGSEEPFYQSTAFLASTFGAVMLFLFVMVFFVMRPETPEALMNRAEEQIAAGDRNGARSTLRTLLKRDANEFTEDAELLYVQIRAENLIERAQNRPSVALDLPGPTMKFYRAFEYEMDKRYQDALTAYDDILTTVSHDKIEERHIVQAVQGRIKAINDQRKNVSPNTGQATDAQPKETSEKSNSKSIEGRNVPNVNENDPSERKKGKILS